MDTELFLRGDGSCCVCLHRCEGCLYRWSYHEGSGIACKVGRELCLEDNQLECLELEALFHDIGKIGVPDHIILGKIEFLSSMIPAVLYHHERPDGKGYPEGLKGDEIPIGASIIAIADTYDAMTSDRPYRTALSHELAVEELKKYRGTQFNKEVVDAFLKIHK